MKDMKSEAVAGAPIAKALIKEYKKDIQYGFALFEKGGTDITCCRCNARIPLITNRGNRNRKADPYKLVRHKLNSCHGVNHQERSILEKLKAKKNGTEH